jgi:DnaJ family protein C protein 11
LKGTAVSHGSLGNAAISTTIHHTFSSIWTGFLTGSIGSTPQLNAGLIRGYGSGFSQLVVSSNTLRAPPRLSILLGNNITQNLTMNVGCESGSFAIGSWGEEELGLYDNAFICGIVKRSGRDFFNTNVRIGSQESHVALEYSTPLTKQIRGKLALALSNRSGVSTTVSASRKITKNIRLGLGLEIATMEGVTFQIRFVRLGQKLNIPLFLSPESSLKVISLALMIPAVITVVTDRWYFAPRKRLHFIQ